MDPPEKQSNPFLTSKNLGKVTNGDSCIKSNQVSPNQVSRTSASRHMLQRPCREIHHSDLTSSFESIALRSNSLGILRVKTHGAIANRECHSFLNLSLSCRSLQSAGSVHSLKGNVSFDKVSVRGYERILGDNPSVSNGPPIRFVK